ncbi:MAG: hypothetical protein IKT27_06915 [Clostridia bacterium]|nr:hypothetical protein [Clostridia bacterium]
MKNFCSTNNKEILELKIEELINITIKNGLLFNAIRNNRPKNKPINSHLIHSQYGEFLDEVRSMPRVDLEYFASKLNQRFKFYADCYCKYSLTLQLGKAEKARELGEAIYSALVYINKKLQEPELAM